MTEAAKRPAFGVPAPRNFKDEVTDRPAPGRGWEIGEETKRAMDEIDRARRPGPRAAWGYPWNSHPSMAAIMAGELDEARAIRARIGRLFGAFGAGAQAAGGARP